MSTISRRKRYPLWPPTEPTPHAMHMARLSLLDRLIRPNPQTGLSYVRRTIFIEHERCTYRIEAGPLLEEYGVQIEGQYGVEGPTSGGHFVRVPPEKLEALQRELKLLGEQMDRHIAE